MSPLEVLERKWINEPEASGIFSSAFIQAARSVQWVLGRGKAKIRRMASYVGKSAEAG